MRHHPALLALAELIWAQPQPESLLELDDSEDLIATLFGLDLAGLHDPLARCTVPGCGAWFWGEDGAVLTYEDSGRSFEVCAGHAYPDDPGCRVYPGVGLEALWREERTARAADLIREYGADTHPQPQEA